MLEKFIEMAEHGSKVCANNFGHLEANSKANFGNTVVRIFYLLTAQRHGNLSSGQQVDTSGRLLLTEMLLSLEFHRILV